MLRALRRTVPFTAPVTLSILQALGGGTAGWAPAHIALLVSGAALLPTGPLCVLWVTTALSAASPGFYAGQPGGVVARVMVVLAASAVGGAIMRPLRGVTRDLRGRRLEVTSALAVDGPVPRSADGDQRAAEAALRQLGVGCPGAQPPASRRAKGRFMASSAERTAATARSPRDSAEPT